MTPARAQTMKTNDILSSLQRTDKWYLAGGNRLMYAPPFAPFRDIPGFWDEAHYYNYPFKPLYSWTLLTKDGAEVELVLSSSVWRPDHLTRTFVPRDTAHKITITECSSLLPLDVIISEISIRNRSSRRSAYSLAAWTVRESNPVHGVSFAKALVEEHIFSCEQMIDPEHRPGIRFGFSFTLAGRGVRHQMRMSEGSPQVPQWSVTPFADSGGIPASSEAASSPIDDPAGSLFVGLQSDVRLGPRTTRTLRLGCAVAPSPVEARSNLSLLVRKRDPLSLSTVAWNDHFRDVPTLETSDPYIDRAYAYRWYGLRLNTIISGEQNYEYPFTCEGIGYFRAPISYSAPCHMLENRWMGDPELARGSLLTFIHHQREDGGFRGYIDVGSYREEMFYHANWGKALLAVEAIHPSDAFLRTAYEGLKKYAAYFDRERDDEVSGLYDIDNHYETGQEYMRRYTVVNPSADRDHWGEIFRLKGVDVTVYIYELKRALAVAADRLGLPQEADLWNLEADKTRAAVRERMWDPKDQMFYDIDPRTGRRTRVKAATCFYPYFTDIVTEQHLAGFKKHLFSPKEFWSPWPVPSTSMDDPSFSAEPLWKGKRMNCPWNGRVWPMTNSHIMEALASCALRSNDRTLEKRAGQFLGKFLRMMFHDQDLQRPNCFEHYNPLNGSPSAYRGVDDYMHSWVNDLILKYVMGIQPGLHSVSIRPLRMGLKNASVSGVRIRGRELSVQISGNLFSVSVDGKRTAREPMGGMIELQI